MGRGHRQREAVLTTTTAKTSSCCPRVRSIRKRQAYSPVKWHFRHSLFHWRATIFVEILLVAEPEDPNDVYLVAVCYAGVGPAGFVFMGGRWWSDVAVYW